MTTPMAFHAEEQRQVVYDNDDGFILRASARYITLTTKNMQRLETRSDLDKLITVLNRAWAVHENYRRDAERRGEVDG
jgi:hypothetical protein